MGVKLYSFPHILYLLITLIVIAVAVILVKKYVKNQKTLNIVIKILAAVLLVSVIINRLTLAIMFDNWKLFIPGSFCGVTSFALSIAVLTTKKNSIFLHCLAYVGFVGGIITLVYPDFIAQDASIFYMPTITGLIHHSLITLLVTVMSVTGYFVPTIKKWYALVLGLCCYMTYGLFLVDIAGIQALSIGQDFEGIKGLTWFNVGLIFIAGCLIYMGIYDLIKKFHQKRFNKGKAIKED